MSSLASTTFWVTHGPIRCLARAEAETHNNNPTAVLENCALTVFVIPVAD